MRELTAKDKVRLNEKVIDNLLAEKGMSRRTLSLELYKGKSFFSNTFREYDGWIKARYLPGIAKILDVPEESLIYKEPEEYENRDISQLTGKELSDLIYKAVYSAVLHAWEND